MNNSVLSIGDKLDLSLVESRYSTDDKTQYVSQVMDFMEDNQISISMPFDKGRLIPMIKGAKYDLYFYTKYGVYYGRCVVTDRYKLNNIFYAAVKLPKTLEKHQRRQYFRLDCLIDIKYRVVTDQEIEDIIYYDKNSFSSPEEKVELHKKLVGYDREYIKTVAIDISGGGMRFNTSDPLQKGQRLMLKFELPIKPEKKLFELMANAVLVTKLMNQDQYEHRVEFYGISKEDREDIIKHIFSEERNKRKSKKG